MVQAKLCIICIMTTFLKDIRTSGAYKGFFFGDDFLFYPKSFLQCFRHIFSKRVYSMFVYYYDWGKILYGGTICSLTEKTPFLYCDYKYKDFKNARKNQIQNVEFSLNGFDIDHKICR